MRFLPSPAATPLVLLVAAFAATSSARAQTALCVQDHGKLAVVGRATGSVAFVEDHGKWIDYPHGPFVLQPVKTYAPVLISIHHQSFQKGQRAISDTGPSPVQLVNSGRFVFLADLTSPVDLDDVILVLDIGEKQGDGQLYLHGIGHLEAHKPERVSLDVVTSYRLRNMGLRHVHVYVRGHEALQTDQPAAERRTAMDRMVSERLEHPVDGPVRPLIVIDPVYPAKLKPRAKGEVVLQCEVGADGRATKASVVRASQPELVEAAQEALHESRFLPAVKDGHPIAASAVVPFAFDPAW